MIKVTDKSYRYVHIAFVCYLTLGNRDLWLRFFFSRHSTPCCVESQHIERVKLATQRDSQRLRQPLLSK